MLKQGIFAVRDTAAESFMPPFMALNQFVAERSFGDAVNDYETPMGRHPEDFALFQVGEFDLMTGVISACEPRHLVLGTVLVKKEVK